MVYKALIYAVSTLALSSAGVIPQTRLNVDERDLLYRPSAEKMESSIKTICSEEGARRGRDRNGLNANTGFIRDAMANEKLLPVCGTSLIQHFTMEDGRKGCNVVGMLEGSTEKGDSSYVIVGAHYDNLGIINGKFYPCADSNASGVAALLEIAASLRKHRSCTREYGGNVIFVAFDRYLDGRKGSEAFWTAIENGELSDPLGRGVINRDKITAMIDIDQIGCTLSPVEKGVRNYMIAIGADSFPESLSDDLERWSDYYTYPLKIYESYYGSDSFTQLFYTLGDRRIFIENGVPTMYFTSGITQNNNSVSDTPDTIDLEVLRKRATLIFKFIETVL